jgi:type III secretory pathway component EscV
MVICSVSKTVIFEQHYEKAGIHRTKRLQNILEKSFSELIKNMTSENAERAVEGRLHRLKTALTYVAIRVLKPDLFGQIPV